MIIRAVHNRNNPYFQVKRETAQDNRLPARALGILIYLMSKPDDWEPTVEDICKRFPDVGRQQAYRIINETFIPLGYARRVCERENGRVVRWITEIYETPVAQNQHVDTPDDEIQHVEEPHDDFQHVDYQVSKIITIQNKRVQNTDRQITERKNTDTPKVRSTGETGPVLEAFSYWQCTLNHPQAKLTPKRQRNIQARLKDGYTLVEIKKAIDGCASSPFHMGQGPNSDGTIYDDIELICRNGEKLEMFISKANGGNGNGRHQVPSHKETHNERAARETAELIAAAFQTPSGFDNPDSADAGPPWLAADFSRL